jgi:hypothetical protein
MKALHESSYVQQSQDGIEASRSKQPNAEKWSCILDPESWAFVDNKNVIAL